MKYLFRLFARFFSKWNIYVVKSLMHDNKNERRHLPINLDYVRYKTLELCSHEIYLNNVKGNVAELGVYKGDFAAKINIIFPDRKLYLFDTFQGFDSRDTGEEITKDFSTGDQDFSDTNIDLVLKKMKFPENCIVKKGYFPESAVDVDDIFAFVSLDADLYKPILAGLEFFYPRLEKGGYIFVHDFNNRDYKGAREAVIKFCKERSIGYLPVPDICGSIAVCK
jgi:O-methyltransferase